MRRAPTGWVPVIVLALAVGMAIGVAAAASSPGSDEVLLTSESEDEAAGDETTDDETTDDPADDETTDDPADDAKADADEVDADDAGVHGGPIERFHRAGVCDLVDVSTLPGNWTHGDYVDAVAALDPALVPVAARSDCGKPLVAVGKGGGPPEHAGPPPWATPGGPDD